MESVGTGRLFFHGNQKCALVEVRLSRCSFLRPFKKRRSAASNVQQGCKFLPPLIDHSRTPAPGSEVDQ